MKLQPPRLQDRERVLSEWLQQGVRLHEARRFDEANDYYAAIQKAQPNHFNAMQLQGYLKSQQGKHEDAVRLIRRALKLNATVPTVHLNLGNALVELLRLQEALDCYAAALALDPAYVEAWSNVGAVLQKLKRFDEALAGLDKAIVLRPDFAEAFYNRGLVLRGLMRLDDALESHDRALALQPGFVGALTGRAETLIALKRPDAALQSCEQVFRFDPDHVEAHCLHGNALRDLDRPDAALASYDRALAIEPDHIETVANRGVTLTELKRPAEAMASFDRALAIDGQHVVSRFARANCQLLTGDLAVAWGAFELRWQSGRTKPFSRYPDWKGENLRGKRIVVHEEQGIGDVLQFARYLPAMVAEGADLTFLVRQSLHRLLAPIAGTLRLIDTPDALGDERYDYQSALLSLPGCRKTTLAMIPPPVNLAAPEAVLVERWRASLGDVGFKVGIVWQGNPDGTVDVGRSIPLKWYAPLAEVPGVRLLSLQKAHGLDQLTQLSPGMSVQTFGPDFDSGPDVFADTLAIMSLLDLVVTSDTAVAHLAGSLGRPVWLALKQVPDWRWMFDRADSPWYPSMTLYRQSTRGDWSDVFVRMAADLRSRVIGADGR